MDVINNIPDSKNRLTIRNMSMNDIFIYSMLFRKVFANPPWNEEWKLHKISMKIKKSMKKKGFVGIAAEQGSLPAGYITGYQLRSFPFISPLFYLDQLFVDDQFRGKGIGKELLKIIMYITSRQNYRGILLLTKTGSPAEKLYYNSGFKRLFIRIKLNGKVVLYKSLS